MTPATRRLVGIGVSPGVAFGPGLEGPPHGDPEQPPGRVQELEEREHVVLVGAPAV